MKNILVIYGGNSYEHDISILTGIQAMRNIDKLKYNVYPIYLKDTFYKPKKPFNIAAYADFKEKDFMPVFISNKRLYIKKILGYEIVDIDAALLCTHGGNGEDGTLQGFLDINNIPYTSSDLYVSNIGMKKSSSKLFLKKIGVRTLKYSLLKKDYDELSIKNIEYPVIVKPNSLGSSIGISIANNYNELKEALDLAFELDCEAIIEKALLNFREFSVACIKYNNKLIVSDIEEPIGLKNFLTFDDKYINENKREYPAAIDKIVENRIKFMASKAYSLLNAKGVVRFDFLLNNDNNFLYMNEFNTIPGSLAFYLFENQGYTYKEIIDMLIEEAIKGKRYINKRFESSVLKGFKGNKIYK